MTTQSPKIGSTPDLRILLLEDYASDAQLIQRHLKKSAPTWQVDLVTNKESFINYLNEQAPDVIVSDYALPSFSGLDAYLVIRELGLEVPFIILTGQLPEASARECVNNGIDDYVLKSSLMRLDHSIRRALERRTAENERDTMAVRLSDSEKRYKAIFEQAGVALAEFKFENHFDTLRIAGQSSTIQRKLINRIIRTLEVTAVNQAALHLFEASDALMFKSELGRMFGSSNIRKLLSNQIQHLSGQASVEQSIEAKTLKGHHRHLLVKTVLNEDRKSYVTVSFTDMTSVRESEMRAMRIVERLEDTVAARVNELSELNHKLKLEAEERERINSVLRNNYIQMTESIIAAKRIQQLLLPRLTELTASFDDAFVYMRPKGIVSGDFYWFHNSGTKKWVACVDCTGHGVPGAFMSMLSSKLLNQAVIENGIEHPDEVLQFIDTYVVRELKQREASTMVSTGMDISLCLFNEATQEVLFAGAYQNLIIKNGHEVEVIKGDRKSLGGTFEHTLKTYSLHKRTMQKGQCFYMFTDGIVDQFGGPSVKKFTRRRLIELIASLNDGNMYDHELQIKSRLQDWKGANEQIDDILVMGIRL
ncbi:MAG: SpoIIE family protein phosphatase [Flavobacteriales bacterium]